MDFTNNLGAFIKKYLFFILALILVVVFYINPELSIDNFSGIDHIFGFIMFGIGMTLTKNDFILVFKKPKEFILGLIIQIVNMFLIAIILAIIGSFSLERSIYITLINFFSIGIFAVVMLSFIAKADVALSVIYIFIFNTVASIAFYFFTDINIIYGNIIYILKFILIPIILGVIANTFFNRGVQKLVKILPYIINLAAAVIIADSVTYSGLILLVLNAIVVIVVINIYSYLGGCLIGKAVGFKEKRRRTLFIIISMMNIGFLYENNYLSLIGVFIGNSFGWVMIGRMSVFLIATYWSNKEITD